MEAFTSIAPAARFEHLIMTDAGGEIVVIVPASCHIHYLNESAATVWRLCDGHASVAGIARSAGMTDVMVRAALAKLSEARLLQGDLASDLRGPAPSRRASRQQAALAVTFPTVVSVTAPMLADANSVERLVCGLVPSDCGNYDVCCTSHCNSAGKVRVSSTLISCEDNPNGGYKATVDCTCSS